MIYRFEHSLVTCIINIVFCFFTTLFDTILYMYMYISMYNYYSTFHPFPRFITSVSCITRHRHVYRYMNVTIVNFETQIKKENICYEIIKFSRE